MNSRLEQYVAEVASGLSVLPEERRREELNEISQHLAALAGAHHELGASEAEAADAAIVSFGDARTVGRGIRWMWWRERTLALRESLGAVAAFTAVTWGVYAVLRSLGAEPANLTVQAAPLALGAFAAAWTFPRRAAWGPAFVFAWGTFWNLHDLLLHLHVFGISFSLESIRPGLFALIWRRGTGTGEELITAIGFDLVNPLVVLLSVALAATLGHRFSKERAHEQPA
jgi:hypothetical protein